MINFVLVVLSFWLLLVDCLEDLKEKSFLLFCVLLLVFWMGSMLIVEKRLKLLLFCLWNGGCFFLLMWLVCLLCFDWEDGLEGNWLVWMESILCSNFYFVCRLGLLRIWFCNFFVFWLIRWFLLRCSNCVSFVCLEFIFILLVCEVVYGCDGVWVWLCWLRFLFFDWFFCI